MSPVSIRPAGIGDVDALALVGAATFLETFAGLLDGDAIVTHCRRAHSAEVYRDYLGQDIAAAWLAIIQPGGAPVGFALLARPDLPGADPVCDVELKRIYLLSRWHGHGAGRALMDVAIAKANAIGRDRLVLGAFAGNRRALAFYGACGFEPIGRRRFRIGEREYDDIVHALKLG